MLLFRWIRDGGTKAAEVSLFWNPAKADSEARGWFLFHWWYGLRGFGLNLGFSGADGFAFSHGV